MWGSSLKKVCMGLCGILMFGSVWASGGKGEPHKGDSVPGKSTFFEYQNVYRVRKLSTVYPVEVKRKGSSLLVTSEQPQMLPIYKSNGVFYGLFRLNKGTNWISGLPRGTYIINNLRFTLS